MTVIEPAPAVSTAMSTQIATSRLESTLLFAVMATPFISFLYPSGAWWLAAPLVSAAAGWLILRGAPNRVFAAFWLLFLIVQLAGVPWPLSFVLPLVLAFVAARAWPAARAATSWLKWGALTWKVWQVILPTILVSSGGLLAWFVLWHPDVSDIVTSIPPGTSLAVFASIALAFSILNALWEEFLLKGMMWETLKTILPEGMTLNLIQSFFFGLIHYHGFPRGVTGVAMAAFYGFLLGIIRQRSQGMAAVVITHIFADLTICALLYASYTGAIE